MKKEEMDFFSDVYSFGVLLWELLSNKIPYDGYTQHQIIGEVGYDDNYKLRFDTVGSIWREDDFIVQLMD
jgi:serine/threonine protein kinase